MENKDGEKNKTPIFCIDCIQRSGYFEEDFVYNKIEEPKYCKNCGSKVLDKPDFKEPLPN